MMQLIGENMAPIMFGCLIVFLLFGYSVAFSLAACGVFVGFVVVAMGLISLSVPLVVKAYETGEMSSNAGGLIRWPVFALLPIGFAFLGLQGVSELIKRIAFLRGLIPDPTLKSHGKSAEEELAAFLLQEEVAAREAAARTGGRP